MLCWADTYSCEISSSHGGEYEVQNCLLPCKIIRMMEAARTSETSVDNYFTRKYIPEDNSGLYTHVISEVFFSYLYHDISILHDEENTFVLCFISW
jgi:hypothetical protein